MENKKAGKKVRSFWLSIDLIKRLRIYVTREKNKGKDISLSTVVEQAINEFLLK